MIKMVLNNNCVIKMQIITSQLDRTLFFLFILSHCKRVFFFCFWSGKNAISKEDLLQKAFHSVHIEMPCDTDLFEFFSPVFSLSLFALFSAIVFFCFQLHSVAIVVTFTTILLWIIMIKSFYLRNVKRK